jgi:hypothetical protein
MVAGPVAAIGIAAGWKRVFMKLMSKFSLIILVIFGAGGFLIAQLADSFLMRNARREVLQQAQLMMASAESVRNYTATDLSPLLQQNPGCACTFFLKQFLFTGPQPPSMIFVGTTPTT